MLTIRRTARSCPTILPNSGRSKSRTSALLFPGSRSTSSEIYGLTIALYLVPVSPGRCQDSHWNQLPLSLCKSSANRQPLSTSLTPVPSFWWNCRSHNVLSAIGLRGFSGGIGLPQLSGCKDPRISTQSCLRRSCVSHALAQLFLSCRGVLGYSESRDNHRP